MTHTKDPVVLIHGVFGYGRKRPFWNRWLGYWPEHALDDMDANYLIVDVGALSSDHDRACETFYQLYGGRVDYGQTHADRFGHNRYGETVVEPLHPNWSEAHPVHLLGHSVGATTAIELYQLICQDYFKVGSNHRWVQSIVSIAGPLSGTTLTHFFGLHGAQLVGYTLGHAIGASLCLWHRLHSQFPVLKNVFDYHMPQWDCVTSYQEILSTQNRILQSPDLAVYDILPARRLARNQRLVEMDKVFLLSVVTSSSSRVPIMEMVMTLGIGLMLAASGFSWFLFETIEVAIMCASMAFVSWLWLRKRIFLPMIQWRMRCCVQQLHPIFEGFDRDEWAQNDGAVNICSMAYPRVLSTCRTKQIHLQSSDSDSDTSTASSSDSTTIVSPPVMQHLQLNRFKFLTLSSGDKKLHFQRGVWYTHKVRSNHKAGTNFDPEAPQLFRHVLRLVANEFDASSPKHTSLLPMASCIGSIGFNDYSSVFEIQRAIGFIMRVWVRFFSLNFLNQSCDYLTLVDPSYLRICRLSSTYPSDPTTQASLDMTRTQHPVVLVHGIMGYGTQRPFWNRAGPYWPQKALDTMNANYVMVDVGVLSSDHDRACEAFYQLYGGRVDYGQAHAEEHGHDRYGYTYDKPLHPQWSETNPVHLIGHSCGATTALELYQLLCQDYFGVGSNHRWVHSLVSIAGPLSGTTLTDFFGLVNGKILSYTLGHFIGSSLCLWIRLQSHFPVLKNVLHCRMPQWEFVDSYREMMSAQNRLLRSTDLAVYDIVPERRQVRNQRLVDMDKLFLVSIVTSSRSKVPTTKLLTLVGIALLIIVSGFSWYVLESIQVALACACVAMGLWLRLRIFLPMLQWRMRRCVQQLDLTFQGFDRDEWEPNDGVVNLCSMAYPRQPAPPRHKDSDSDSDNSTVSSSSDAAVSSPPTQQLKVNGSGVLTLVATDSKLRFTRGTWYIHTANGSHKAGTSLDRDSPQLFRHVLGLVATELEGK